MQDMIGVFLDDMIMKSSRKLHDWCFRKHIFDKNPVISLDTRVVKVEDGALTYRQQAERDSADKLEERNARSSRSHDD